LVGSWLMQSSAACRALAVHASMRNPQGGPVAGHVHRGVLGQGDLRASGEPAVLRGRQGADGLDLREQAPVDKQVAPAGLRLVEEFFEVPFVGAGVGGRPGSGCLKV
jgi:hypothetical protein